MNFLQDIKCIEDFFLTVKEMDMTKWQERGDNLKLILLM